MIIYQIKKTNKKKRTQKTTKLFFFHYKIFLFILIARVLLFDLPQPLRNHGNFKITVQCLWVEAELNWTKVRLANCHAVFVFISFNFHTHNLLSDTVDKRGSPESCLDTVSEGNQVFMGHPLPFRHWPGKPSFCWRPIQSREVGWLWEGRWPLPCKVKWLCFPPWLIQLISTTVYKNTCAERL